MNYLMQICTTPQGPKCAVLIRIGQDSFPEEFRARIDLGLPSDSARTQFVRQPKLPFCQISLSLPPLAAAAAPECTRRGSSLLHCGAPDSVAARTARACESGLQPAARAVALSKYFVCLSTYEVSAADLVAASTIVAAAENISCVRRLDVDD